MQYQTDRSVEKKDRLYEEHGRRLEGEHKGEYVAIGFDGKTILGKRSGEVLERGLEAFGRGRFGIFRVGHKAFAEWLVIG